MRQLMILGFLIVICGVCEALAQTKIPVQNYLLKLSPDCDPSTLSIAYSLTGPFGEYGSFIRTDRKGCEFQIPTTVDGKVAQTLRLFVKGPKFKTFIYDLPAVSANGGIIEVKLERQTLHEFVGKISSNESITDSWMQIRVIYWAHWKCEQMRSPDCLIGPDLIAKVDIDPDGGFKVSLPDFAADTALAAFSDKGGFEFAIHDRKTGNRVYDLLPEGSMASQREIRVATRYTGIHLFVAKRSN